MKRPSPVLAALLFAASLVPALSTLPAQAAKRSTNAVVSEIMTRAIEDFIQPGYQRFHVASEKLETDIETLCDSPSDETLAAARDAFTQAAVSWSYVEIIRFGPVAGENRYERVLYYPDRRGVGLKQIQSLIGGFEPYPQALGQLQGKSVALQGLPALEYALFGTGAEALASGKDDGRCDYAGLVAANIDAIARELDGAWADPEGISRLWMNPGSDNPVIRDNREALVELLGVVVHGIEMVRDIRLRAFLGETEGTDRPNAAIYRRAGNTFASIAANLQGIQAVFENSGMTLVLSEQDREIGYRISDELSGAIALTRRLQGTAAELLASPESRARLEELRDRLGRIKTLANEDYGNAVGLTAGFSFADGD
ncbi:hypothetical protein E2A64_11635 [Pseudohoeflea suaedae]|uniref:Imelysin-like domain-containing protein n=1 Tax=Pseudohoeflea suaedae TaxID=877384 RepID=A0A4R5PL26_9HYPH|nr:imelysin family protein [Pseudohoeflea suaedae]TDH35954.1 hypothetical protein E2A64_11635 [Pseudohoeflea suaedae]